jgi:hypothetical protein
MQQDFAFLKSLRTNISSLRYYAISVAMSLVVTGGGTVRNDIIRGYCHHDIPPCIVPGLYPKPVEFLIFPGFLVSKNPLISYYSEPSDHSTETIT